MKSINANALNPVTNANVELHFAIDYDTATSDYVALSLDSSRTVTMGHYASENDALQAIAANIRERGFAKFEVIG